MRNKKITSISSILALNNNSEMYTLCACMREGFCGNVWLRDIMSQSEKNFRFVFLSLNRRFFCDKMIL